MPQVQPIMSSADVVPQVQPLMQNMDVMPKVWFSVDVVPKLVPPLKSKMTGCSATNAQCGCDATCSATNIVLVNADVMPLVQPTMPRVHDDLMPQVQPTMLNRQSGCNATMPRVHGDLMPQVQPTILCY